MEQIRTSTSARSHLKNLAIGRRGTRGLDLICLSHLRWNFVYQRPQHLMSRASKFQRVFFFEEPMFDEGIPWLQVSTELEGPFVVVPHLPHGLSETEQVKALRFLIDQMMRDYQIEAYMNWYLTPMSVKFTRHLRPDFCVYDCMDQLSHFKGASPEIPILENELFALADMVFTGGHSLYQEKCELHPDVHAFPSSVDVSHFGKARLSKYKEDGKVPSHDPISEPRIGYLGVIDERIDFALIEQIARLRPQWQLMMVGPVVKIDEKILPRLPNIHYLGAKPYAELPDVLASWEIAILPFAKNDATRYISPTKTPEYLSAGKRVISTSIRDVVSPYGDRNLVSIADNAEGFVAHAERLLRPGHDAYVSWLYRVDKFLGLQSWDRTFSSMWSLINKSLIRKQTRVVFPEAYGGMKASSSGFSDSIGMAAAPWQGH